MRDTVYNGLLKRARAQLHIDFVRWADKVNAERDRALEFEEILGYHLEQAHRYLSELGPLDEAGVAIGVDAAQRLSARRAARVRARRLPRRGQPVPARGGSWRPPMHPRACRCCPSSARRCSSSATSRARAP